jgi:pimeloyl-ACP methyl ester carboxylesterase
MTLFALLHGGMHYGSSWDLVAAELRACGHRVVAPDLPVDDESAGACEWAQCAIDAIDAVTERVDTDVVVVGHSIAGLCVPVVAANRAVRNIIFVAGLIPAPGHTFAAHLAENPGAITFAATLSADGGPFGLTWESVRDGFYHDCPEALARQAFDELRNQSFKLFTETCPINRWPDTPSTYVLMRDDRAVGEPWARRNAVDRIGASVVELDGGHSPFFARPAELGDVLLRLGDSDVNRNRRRSDEF